MPNSVDAAASLPAGATRSTLLPLRKRSTPSTTTQSPTVKPERNMLDVPSLVIISIG